MAEGRIAELPRRGVVAVSGPDAVKWLNDLITVDLPETAAYGGLLSPQGKILFDFIILRDRDRYFFDIARNKVADFVKRLGVYRLRANIDVSDLSEERIVIAAWGRTDPPIVDGPVAADPRLASLGFRAIVPPGADMAPDYAEVSEADYDAHRIGLGVPEGGTDFGFGEAFPHDADMDQLGGIDFKKGCFVGQEVVSRMEHRGTARRRIVMAKAASTLPAAGTPIMAGDLPLGTLGSSAQDAGLAVLRLDRAKEAMDAGAKLSAAQVEMTIQLPAWARFGWPTTVAED